MSPELPRKERPVERTREPLDDLEDGDVKKAKVYIENALSWLKKMSV